MSKCDPRNHFGGVQHPECTCAVEYLKSDIRRATEIGFGAALERSLIFPWVRAVDAFSRFIGRG